MVKGGQRFTFDQYTAADHNPHSVPAHTLLELTGTRGMYLGDGTGTKTGHLLLRGITIEIDSVGDADIETPTGTVHRRIVQAHIVEETP